MVLAVFLHTAKIDCRKSVLCVFTFAMLVSQFTVLFWVHICSKETTTSCFLYISAVQLSNSSLLLFCSGTCIWFVSRWSFFLYSANQTLIHLDLHKGKADEAD